MPCPLVQAVDVLRDHRVEQPGSLELDERRRGRGWAACPRASGSARRRSARIARGRGGRRRCARPPSDRPSPTARSRASGSRGSRTAPRSRRRSAPRPSGLVDQAREPAAALSVALTGRESPSRSLAVSLRGTHRPRNRALRLLQERRDPLARVLGDEHVDANACFSASMPSSRSPGGGDPLDLLDRERRLLGQLPRPRERGVEQLVIGRRPGSRDRARRPRRPAIGSPVRFISSALRRRRPAAAAAGCRRSRG